MSGVVVKITGYASGGEGVARLSDGRVVFVSGAARGDVVEIRIIEDKPRITRAEILRIHTPSQYRIAPDCPHYPLCGGCDFRHITYEEELAAKLLRVNDALSRIGAISMSCTEILSTGRIDGYRNKAVLHSDGVSRGFYSRNSHIIVPVEHCRLLKDDINTAIKGVAPGKEVILRSGRNGLNSSLEEELDGLIFGISGFFQVNTEAALLLFQKAREYAAVQGGETLADLYCGVGSLTLFVGRDSGRAVGVEQNTDSVKLARLNAKRNGLAHIEFICEDAAKTDLESLCPDCIIVDPPRKGLSPAMIRKIIKQAPKRIVYISCDPATLARDLRALEGYVLKKICAVDMFPRTANVECCSLLHRFP